MCTLTGFCASNAGLNPQYFSNWPFQGGSSVAVLLYLCVRGFICGDCFDIHLFLISPSFGASGGLCFLIVEFPGYFH